MDMDMEELNKRLEKIENLNVYLDNLIRKIPVKIPDNIRDLIIDNIFNNKEIDELINNVKERRPPKFVLIGRTGCGKSSLINAMFGEYLAETSDVEVGTMSSSKFTYKSDGQTVLEVIDTRGIGESKNNNKAEKDLEKTIEDFSPDAILFLAKAKERAHIDKDVKTLKKISSIFNDKIPIVALRTQVDELEPSRYKDPEKYTKKKVDNITQSVEELEKILSDNNINPMDTIPVSAYVEWYPDPQDVSDTSEIEMEFEGFYNIDKLTNKLINNLDLKASIFLMGALRGYEELVETLSKSLTKGFSGAAAAIGATPIPTSDIFILTPLQAILIIIIAYLSGREIGYEDAKDFLSSFGVLGGAALGLQQAAKALNVFLPGSGSAISSGIAAGGTWAIGKAAYMYYCEGKDMDYLVKFVKEEFKKYKNEFETKKA